MHEYDRANAVFYDCYSTGLEGDVQFYVEEARKTDTPVLELGCGTGRILIPIAEAGAPIVGLDRASAMLTLLRNKLSTVRAETRARIELVEGDMRHFSLGRQFKLIIIPYRAFLHLLTPKDQRQALHCIQEHLVDGGRLIIDVFDPNLESIAAHLGPLGLGLQRDVEFIHPDSGRQVVTWAARHYDPERQLLEQYVLFEELDDEGRVLHKIYQPLTLRYVYRYEMRYLLELCGYHIEALYGDFQRRPYRYGGEQIWVARKKAGQ